MDLQRSQTARILAKQADNVIILTDSSKFDEKGTVTEFQFLKLQKCIQIQKFVWKIKTFEPTSYSSHYSLSEKCYNHIDEYRYIEEM